jgi:uncharacterized protein YjiS (DUF1127 family)
MPLSSQTIESFSTHTRPAHRAHGPLAAVRRYFAQGAIRRRYRRDAAQLCMFSERDLWDIGLTRSDLPSIAEGTYSRN